MAFASGLLVSREKAQISVSSALGSNVGSSVLNLIVLWGICVILGRQNTSTNSTKCKGVITNNLTGYIAGIMFLSLLPFTIMLLGDIISSAVGKSITILVALIVSVTFLLSYFTYQMWNTLIQQKRIEYIKHQNLLESGKFKVDSDFALSTLSRIFDQNKVMWGEFDKFLDEVEKGNHRRFNHSLVLKWDICKSELQVILGIAILTLCADPIMDNIIRLASAIGVPSFFLSFVIVPLAINVSTAITAVTLLSSANQQSGTTSSLTFSELLSTLTRKNRNK
ncbi:sodium/calcium exchanger NCL2-like [Solanum pennellii]|uniref:Sodium/calcium exchanger NCL2-like n=1 Tax=Solanum pennellii TaxID=28526 RepID=A0ABM1V9G1_SOLPN|nr:sodium/calcium exchanger NCL2-like [Solanum pennellii]